jgi:hypothetical protein
MMDAPIPEVFKRATWASLSRAVSIMLAGDGEWCGIPMPVEGLSIEVEDKNPWAEKIHELGRIVNEPASFACSQETMDTTIINSWYSRSQQCTISVVDINGKRGVVRHNYDLGRRSDFMMHQLMATTAWHVEAEQTAQRSLEKLIKPHLFAAYQLTGAFLETSARSRLIYVFRRGRPTLVFSRNADGFLSILTALCLHPIGYYRESFAGSLTPTDDVIAHLLLMRGDEHLYWRRANQHPPYMAEAGL